MLRLFRTQRANAVVSVVTIMFSYEVMVEVRGKVSVNSLFRQKTVITCLNNAFARWAL